MKRLVRMMNGMRHVCIMRAARALSSFGLACVFVSGVSSAAVSSPYGVCAHITFKEPPARTCATVRSAGFGWVRANFLWGAVERDPGVWDFSKYDNVVSVCEAEGVQLLPILCGSVPWAKPAYSYLDEWEGFVRQVVLRYGRRLPVLEVWNEQNLDGFWKDPNPTNYIALLRRTYETVKAIDPSIRVAFGGTSGFAEDFIEKVYENGGAAFFDIMNVHPYSSPFRPEGNLDEGIERLRRLMAKYGDGEKPLWITEIGWTMRQVKLQHAELLLLGLKAARPDLASWRVVYVPARGEAEWDLEKSCCSAIADILPAGSHVEASLPADLGERLRRGDVDAVAYPFSEHYASDSVEAVQAFVKEGGVLLDFGGCPMNCAFRTSDDGSRTVRDTKADVRADRRRLRIDVTANWIDRRYPKKAAVHPTDAASCLEEPQEGFPSSLFLTGRLLKQGDEFIPLLAGGEDGMEVVSAAVYRFDSDMKGAVVASCLREKGDIGSCTEERQAKMAARSLGIAFAEGVENFFWYKLRQGAGWGLMNDDFAPKRALGAYRAFMSARPAGSVQKDVAWRSSDRRIYCPQWKRPDGRSAGMIWTIGREESRQVAFSSSKMSFFDMSGDTISPTGGDGVYTLPLSGSPIYFIGGEMDVMNMTGTKQRRN